MSELPKGWVKTELGELGDWSSGGTPSRTRPEYYGGNIPWVKKGDLEDRVLLETPEKISELGLKNSSAKTFPSGTLLIAMYGATIGKTALLGVAASTNQACAAFLPSGTSKEIIPFLWKYLLGSKAHFISAGQGGAQPNISQALIKKFPIKLPPLPEQKRIVAELDALSTKCARARTELARIETLVSRYKQAVLSKAFDGQLTAEWRQKTDWPTPARLGDVAISFEYGSSAKSQKEGRVPVLRMGNLQQGELDWSDLVYTDDEREIERYRLSSGDVLFNRTNSPALVGKTALFRGEREAIFAGYLIRIEAGPRLRPGYLTNALNSPMGRAFSWEAKTDGVSQSNISATKLKEFSFSIPALEEQDEIVRRIETAFIKIDRLAAEAKRALTLVGKLDEAILAKAFRGELVPQDENDEPASVLLDRIRAERATAPKPKRGRKT